MRASDLDLRELLAFEPSGGILRFASERALLIDAVAMGILRTELIETLGMTGARALLTRFGYAHGWRTAETLKRGFPWDSDDEWRKAGGRLHTLQGLVRVEPAAADAAVGGRPQPVGNSVWHDSYEAEQHLLHLGRADEPVCWTLTGFASGYLSRAYGRDIYCLEERCRGKGDAVCRLVGRPVEEWGEDIAAHLPFYRSACLDAALAQATDELKKVERRLRSRRQALGTPDAARVSGMVVQSAEMRQVVELARRVAQVDSTVLITGESGVGKERIARLIHHESARAAGPFVAVNCGAVPETLLESELFGHARGAFTGATQDRPGLFEAAHGGTLLLDEIGEVPPAVQVKLLRVIQEREVRRVGENRGRPVNVRLLAATNRDLTAEIHAARFRQDLYYRLRVVEIRVPALRERRDDILPLARAFLEATAARMRRKVTGFTPAAAQQMLRYAWPGNVRELENAIERATVLATRSRIDVGDLPPEVRLAVPDAFAPGEARTLAEVERDYIQAVLRAAGGNRTKAAATLGIGAATLYRKLKAYEGGPARRTGQ
ncbi:MAG: sigma 54-interacting transcriptional regulator [Acidobacteriota bacterium]